MFELHILIQGYPGKTVYHGGLGWSTVALLRRGSENILIDTGHHMHRKVIAEKLAALGLHRDQITGIALTHCHWDHAINFPIFPKAHIFVSRAELEWAAKMAPGEEGSIAELHVEKLLAAKNVTRIEDGDEFVPGLRALATPGHTPGHMGYLAAGERGTYIFTGDAIKNAGELVSQRVDMTLNGDASRATISKVRTMAASDPGNVLIFGHDRICSFDGAHVHELAPLQAAIESRLDEDFDRLTMFDLTRAGVTAHA